MLVSLAGVAVANAETKPLWTVLVALDSRGSLVEASAAYRAELTAAAARQPLQLGIQELRDDGAGGTRTVRFRWQDGRLVPLTVSAAEATLGGFVRWGVKALPAQHVALLLVQHGTGLLPEPESQRVPLSELSSALREAVSATGQRLSVLGLDLCFGASVEAMWELREVAEYVTAAPGVIFSPGLRWGEVLAANAQLTPQALAERVVRAGMTRGTLEAPLVSIESARISAVAEAVRGLSASLRSVLREQSGTITFVRSRARSWGNRRELCDLGELAAGLQQAFGAAPAGVQAEGVRSAARQAVVASRWGAASPPDEALGLGIYFPPNFEEMPPEYSRLAFASHSGWDGFLGDLWSLRSSLVVGGANQVQ